MHTQKLIHRAKALVLLAAMLGCTDVTSPTSTLEPVARSDDRLVHCIEWVEGCADVAPYYPGGGGGEGIVYDAPPVENKGPLFPLIFDIKGTYRGHPFEGTALRDGFSSAYDGFFTATDGSGCTGFLMIDLSVGEAITMWTSGETKLGNYRFEMTEGC